MIHTNEIFSPYLITGLIVIVLFLIPFLFKKLLEGRLLKLLARRQSGTGRIIVRQLPKFLWFLAIVGSILTVRFLFSDQIPSSVDWYLLSSIRLLLTLSFVWFFNKIFQEGIHFYSRRGKLPQTTIFANLTRLGIFAIALSLVMASLGFSIAPLIATIGVGGLAIALALQDTLSSLFAGIYIIMSKQINQGDYVRLSSNEEGFIQDINWRNTTIRTRENNIIIVPNRVISNLTITNFSLLSKEMSLVIPVGIHYDSDLELAETLAIEVGQKILNELPGGVPDFVPLIRYNTFAESSINFNVILRIQEYTSQGIIRHNFIKALRVKFNEFGIKIPYPMRTLTFEEKLDVMTLPATP